MILMEFTCLGRTVVIFPWQTALSVQALHLIFTHGVVLVLHMHSYRQVLKKTSMALMPQ